MFQCAVLSYRKKYAVNENRSIHFYMIPYHKQKVLKMMHCEGQVDYFGKKCMSLLGMMEYLDLYFCLTVGEWQPLILAPRFRYIYWYFMLDYIIASLHWGVIANTVTKKTPALSV